MTNQSWRDHGSDTGIILHLNRQDSRYRPGDVLSCEYRLALPKNLDTGPDEEQQSGDARKTKGSPVAAVETSVLWFTEGKGDEDIGVHFFERREKKSVLPELLGQVHKLNTVLPASPLSYQGQILAIHWCVRVRVFLSNGSQLTEDVPFQLGTVDMETDSKEPDSDSPSHPEPS